MTPSTSTSRACPTATRSRFATLRTTSAGIFNLIESKTMKEKFSADPAKWWNEDELLAISLKAPIYSEPGEKHYYSNTHTVLLAKVIEKATGKSWQDEVAARVFKPLGLKETTIAKNNELPQTIRPRLRSVR